MILLWWSIVMKVMTHFAGYLQMLVPSSGRDLFLCTRVMHYRSAPLQPSSVPEPSPHSHSDRMQSGGVMRAAAWWDLCVNQQVMNYSGGSALGPLMSRALMWAAVTDVRGVSCAWWQRLHWPQPSPSFSLHQQLSLPPLSVHTLSAVTAEVLGELFPECRK